MRKNRNALMVESLDKHLNATKNICADPVLFEQYKREILERTIKAKRAIGDSKFLNSKEWKQYLIQQKLNDIEKDF